MQLFSHPWSLVASSSLLCAKASSREDICSGSHCFRLVVSD